MKKELKIFCFTADDYTLPYLGTALLSAAGRAGISRDYIFYITDLGITAENKALLLDMLAPFANVGVIFTDNPPDIKDAVCLETDILFLDDPAGPPSNIVHLSGDKKPWHDPAVDFGREWWAITRASPFYDEIFSRSAEIFAPLGVERELLWHLRTLRDEKASLEAEAAAGRRALSELAIIKSSRAWRLVRCYYSLKKRLAGAFRLFKNFHAGVSVIIPVKNAERELPELLRSLKNQRGVHIREIIVIDSGSEDGTAALCEAYRARMKAIKPEDFSHSGTRNLGVSLAKSRYTLLMTQDASMRDKRGLSLMLRFLIKNNLAAVSCREIPRRQTDFYHNFAYDMHIKALGLDKGDLILENPHSADIRVRRHNAQLSDVCCLAVRKLQLSNPYRGEFGEDLDFGLRLINQGYKLGMMNSVGVLHSHDRPPDYVFARCFIDYLTVSDLFDYPGDGAVTKEAFTASIYDSLETLKKQGAPLKCGRLAEITDILLRFTGLIAGQIPRHINLMEDMIKNDTQNAREYFAYVAHFKEKPPEIDEYIFAAALGVLTGRFCRANHDAPGFKERLCDALKITGQV